ncbi:hypothetical protein HN385_08530 [archaeon]|jgi:hypothetical protein|nr:hypothetical protein [archaeon]MBT7192657.1 hypothetical protein [archaeon]MBT7381296.1 hypothetical protein [archaeon]MBT7507763.1 hypothetical protein [archaeon]
MKRRNRKIHFRFTEEEYFQITKNVKENSYISISEFVRHKLLERDTLLLEKIYENNKLLKKVISMIQDSAL